MFKIKNISKTLCDQLILGFIDCKNIQIIPMLFIVNFVGYFICDDYVSLIILLDIFIFGRILTLRIFTRSFIPYKEQSSDDTPPKLIVLRRKNYAILTLCLRHLLSRCLIWWLLYTYSEFTDNYVILLMSPILLSWYMFDPFLLMSRKMTITSRLEFFLKRYPYYIGCGILPCIIIYYNLLSPSRILVLLSVMCSHKNNNSTLYKQWFPSSGKEYIIDPIEFLESLI